MNEVSYNDICYVGVNDTTQKVFEPQVLSRVNSTKKKVLMYPRAYASPGGPGNVSESKDMFFSEGFMLRQVP